MNNIMTLPAISLRGLVIFPSMVLHFDVGRERSVAALKAAAAGDGKIFLVAQKDAGDTEPTAENIYNIGVVAEIRQLLTTPDGSTRVLVEGLFRAKTIRSVPCRDYLKYEVKQLRTRFASISPSTETAAKRALKETFDLYASMSPKMPRDLYESIMSEEDCSRLFDKVVFNIMLSVEDKQKLLETNGTLQRIRMLIAMLHDEIEVIQAEIEIGEQVREQVDKNQREYYLREQLKAISRQLGDSDSPAEEFDEYVDKITALGLPKDSEEKLIGEAERLSKLSGSSQEAAVLRTYLDTVLSVPFNKKTKDKTDINAAAKQLDKDHYGLEKVK